MLVAAFRKRDYELQQSACKRQREFNNYDDLLDSETLDELMDKAGVAPTNQLGQGTFGAVYYSALNSLRDVVFKHLECDPLDPHAPTISEARDEGAITMMLSKDNHPHIGRCFAHGALQFGAHYVMVCERYHVGSLYDLMKPDKQPFALLPPRRVFKHTLLALAHMHKNGYAHYDVKPANLMVCNRRRLAGESNHYDIRLIDFGTTYQLRVDDGVVSRELMGYDTAELLGAFSPPYRPPERWVCDAEFYHLIGAGGDQSRLKALEVRPSIKYPYLTTADVWAAAVATLDYEFGAQTFEGSCNRNIRRMGELWGLPTPDEWPEGDDYLRFAGIRAYVALRDRTTMHPRLVHRLKSQGAFIVAAPKVAATRHDRIMRKRPVLLRTPLDSTLFGVNADKHWKCNACIEMIVAEWNPCNRLDAEQALQKLNEY